MKKTVIFAFRDDLMCFIHVLLNALEMKSKGYETGIVLEGASVTLVAQLATPDNPMAGLYRKSREHNLILGACKACCAKLGALEAVEAEGLRLIDDMSGHASISRFIDEGYEVITL